MSNNSPSPPLSIKVLTDDWMSLMLSIRRHLGRYINTGGNVPRFTPVSLGRWLFGGGAADSANHAPFTELRGNRESPPPLADRESLGRKRRNPELAV